MVLYYTGTGNSRHIAERLARDLSDSLYCINDGLKTNSYPDPSPGEKLVFSFPTYAWNIPRPVRKWIRDGGCFSGRQAWFVMNCGANIGDAPRYLRLLCSRKGMAYMGCARIRMPDNYIAMYNCPSEEESIQIVEKADGELPAVASLIRDGQPLPKVPVFIFGIIFSAIINPLFYVFYIGSRRFRATDTCTGCGTCVELCPLNGIRLEEGRPVWNGKCTHCMACICGCPSEAIQYGRRSAKRRRYHCPETDNP